MLPTPVPNFTITPIPSRKTSTQTNMAANYHIIWSFSLMISFVFTFLVVVASTVKRLAGKHRKSSLSERKAMIVEMFWLRERWNACDWMILFSLFSSGYEKTRSWKKLKLLYQMNGMELIFIFVSSPPFSSSSLLSSSLLMTRVKWRQKKWKLQNFFQFVERSVTMTTARSLKKVPRCFQCK